MNKTDLYYEDFLDLFKFYDLNFNENEFDIYLCNYQINDKLSRVCYKSEYFSPLLQEHLYRFAEMHDFDREILIEKIINIILKPIIRKINKNDELIIINSFKKFQYFEFKYFCFELLIEIFKKNNRDNYFNFITQTNKNALEKYFNSILIQQRINKYNNTHNKRINLFNNWKNTPIFLKYFSFFIHRGNKFHNFDYDILYNSDFSEIITHNNKFFSQDEFCKIGIEKIKGIFKSFNLLDNDEILTRFKWIFSKNEPFFNNDLLFLIIGYLSIKCPKDYNKIINFFYDKYKINSIMHEEDVIYKIKLEEGVIYENNWKSDTYLWLLSFFKNNLNFQIPEQSNCQEYFNIEYLKTNFINIRDKIKKIILQFLDKYYNCSYIDSNIDIFIENNLNPNNRIGDKYIFPIIVDNINDIDHDYLNILIYKYVYYWDNSSFKKYEQNRNNEKNYSILLDSFDSRKAQNNLKEYFSNFDTNINYTNIDPIVLIDNNMLSVINRCKFAYYEQLGDILYSVIIHDLILDAKLEYTENYQQYYMSAFFQNKLATKFDLSQYIQSNGLHYGEKEKFENADYLEALLYQIYKTNDYSIAKNFLIELLSKNDFIKDTSEEEKEFLDCYWCLNNWLKAYPDDFNFSKMGLLYDNTTLTVDFYNKLKRNLFKEIIQFIKLETINDKSKFLDDVSIIKRIEMSWEHYTYELLLESPNLINSSYELINECYRLFKKDSDTFILNMGKLINKND